MTKLSKPQPGKLIQRIQKNIARVFIGKEQQVRMVLLGFFAGLHVLIEDVPGVGKTTLARSLAASTGLDLGRIQFTPDLLPGDIVGMTVWSPEKRSFLYQAGAIMHQFVLADEINRASPRTQSSLLEAMQEGSVTVDGNTYRLSRPFFVIATQNPVNFLGAFPLPEGELDRFGLSLSLGYPGAEEEISILDRFKETQPLEQLKAVTGAEEILELQTLVRKVFLAGPVKQYIVRIAGETRINRYCKLGLSPRATQHLMQAAQAQALFSGREFVIPEDVREVAPYVLTHRLILSAEAGMENVDAREVIRRILNKIPLPSGINER